jgi:hypothetical protein
MLISSAIAVFWVAQTWRAVGRPGDEFSSGGQALAGKQNAQPPDPDYVR